jgi:hypothetical protein
VDVEGSTFERLIAVLMTPTQTRFRRHNARTREDSAPQRAHARRQGHTPAATARAGRRRNGPSAPPAARSSAAPAPARTSPAAICPILAGAGASSTAAEARGQGRRRGGRASRKRSGGGSASGRWPRWVGSTSCPLSRSDAEDTAATKGTQNKHGVRPLTAYSRLQYPTL